jgi:hypothetical protein
MSIPSLPAAAPYPTQPASPGLAVAICESRPGCGRPASWNGSARIVCGRGPKAGQGTQADGHPT